MAGLTVYEFDAIVAERFGDTKSSGLRFVPPHVFDWLESQALRSVEIGESAWLRLTQRQGCKAIQVTSFVGVIRTPCGYQIEVLPKVAKAIGSGDGKARKMLIEMLCCLGNFRHIKTKNASILAASMPLLEVFIAEFLSSIEQVVKRGIRSDFSTSQNNQFALRGKLQMAEHLRKNLCRRDRFFVEFDEFSPDRPENRLLHAALRRAVEWTSTQNNQQFARELCFIFSDIPLSLDVSTDFRKVRLDRGMAYYETALAWARLILTDESPLTGSGNHQSPSLLFPMEAVFEAYVAKHLKRQLTHEFTLHEQVSRVSLVRHLDKQWFRLKPDLLVLASSQNHLVLDTKWKLIDGSQANGTEKYGLSQNDFYQLYAYGQNYLEGKGDLVLIYPKTDSFSEALSVFEFPKSSGLRLWVLPFCLEKKQMELPACGRLDGYFFTSV